MSGFDNSLQRTGSRCSLRPLSRAFGRQERRASGYVETLKSHHLLVLLDARGHGASDKPHDPTAYHLPLKVGDVVAVLDALKIRAAHLWGYSMGGWIGWGMAKYAPERVQGLIIGGAHGAADSVTPRMQECVQHMPHASFVSFPGLNHPEAFWRADVVLPAVMEFLHEMRDGRQPVA